MKDKVMKAVLFLFVAVCVLFSVPARLGMRGLYSLVDFPSLCWIILGILFTGLNFRLKDIFTVLLYPVNRKTVAERPQYYEVILKKVNSNIFRFALLAFVMGVYFCFSRIESNWCLISGILNGTIPLFYAFVIMIFIIKPIETAIKQIENKEKHNFK